MVSQNLCVGFQLQNYNYTVQLLQLSQLEVRNGYIEPNPVHYVNDIISQSVLSNNS